MLTELNSELTKLELRRDEIHAEHMQARGKLADEQQRLIAAPTSETLDALAGAQSRASALANALVSLDAQIAEERERFEAATREAETKARRARIADCNRRRIVKPVALSDIRHNDKFFAVRTDQQNVNVASPIVLKSVERNADVRDNAAHAGNRDV